MDSSKSKKKGGEPRNKIINISETKPLGFAHKISSLISQDLDSLFIKPLLIEKSSGWFGHVPFAHWLMGVLKPNLLVELGTHNGVSYSAFCSSVLREELNTRCYAVDTWQGDEHAGFYDGTVYSNFKKFHDDNFKHFSTLLRKTFNEALEHFGDGTIDLLHIDGLHTYDAVAHDYKTWETKISSRGVVLFHDINEYKEGFGVWKFWQEVRELFPSFEFLHGHGLGVLLVGEDRCSELAELCSLRRTQQDSSVLQRFEVLGTAWETLSATLNEKLRIRSELTSTKETKVKLEARITSLETTEIKLNEQINNLDQELTRNKEEVKKQLNEKANLAGKIQELENKFKTSELKCDQANIAVATLKEEQSKLSAEKERLQQLHTDIQKNLEVVLLNNQELKSSLTKLKQKNDEFKLLKVDKLLQDFEVQQQTLYTYSVKLEYLTRRESSLIGQIEELNSEIAELSKLNESLKLELNQEKLAHENSRNEAASKQIFVVANQTLQEENQILGEELVAAKLAHASAHARLDSLTMLSNKSASELAEVTQERAELINQIKELKLSLDNHKNQITTLQIDCHHHRESNCCLQKELMSLMQTQEEFSKTKDLLEAKLKDATEALTQILSSNSWQLTKPLRKVANSISNIKSTLSLQAIQDSRRRRKLRRQSYKALKKSPIFDADWYVAAYPELKIEKAKALWHYLETGEAQGLNPSGQFDTALYLELYSDVNPLHMSPLYHYAQYGQKEGRICTREQLIYQTIKESPLFDAVYYSQTYDIKDEDPVSHYINIGARTCDPSATFSTAIYLDQNSDIVQSNINPLYHYIKYGQREGRISNEQALVYTTIKNSPLFDADYYRAYLKGDEDPIQHYINKGYLVNNPSPDFSTSLYLQEYPEVADSGINPLYHYIKYGRSEGRICTQNELVYRTLKTSELFDEDYYSNLYSVTQDPILHYIEHGYSSFNTCPDFSSAVYLEQYPEIGEKNINPLFHYITIGQKEGRITNHFEKLYRAFKDCDLFDEEWYFAQNPDIDRSDTDAIHHYIVFGSKELRSPSAEFDIKFYTDQYPDILASGSEPLYHYLICGRNEGRVRSHADFVKKTIERSELFDANWYQKQYLEDSSQDPVEHFINIGSKKGNNPSQKFDTSFYLKTYPDVILSGINPLFHYLQYGKQEDRKINIYELIYHVLNTSELFDKGWYLTQLKEDELYQDPVRHYIEFGANLGLNPSPKFQTTFYQSLYQESIGDLNPLYHYITKGKQEGCSPTFEEFQYQLIKASPLFNKRWYRQTYPDVGSVKADPVRHYIDYGAREGRDPSPEFSTSRYFLLNPDVDEAKLNPLFHYLTVGKKEGRLISTSLYNSKNQRSPNIRAKTISGRMECFGKDIGKGWILGTTSPDLSEDLLPFIVTADDAECDILVSYSKRPDVDKAYNVCGSYEFTYELPIALLDGRSYAIKIESMDANCRQVLFSYELTYKSPWIAEIKPKKQQRRVLFCSHTLRGQGAQTSLFELALGLKCKFGIEPILYSPSDGPMRQRYEEHNIPVIIDDCFNLEKITEQELEAKLQRTINKVKLLEVDAIVANTLKSFQMIHVAKHAGIHSIFIPRESENPRSYFQYLPEHARALGEQALKTADEVIFVADQTRKIWTDYLPGNKFDLIHNSLDTAKLYQIEYLGRNELRKSFGFEHDDIILLSLGTVCPRKGQADFVKTFPKLLNLSPKVKIILVGMAEAPQSPLADYNQNIKDQISGLTPEQKRRITLIQETDHLEFTQPANFYEMADIFVFTSRIESFPRVVLEAMYYGLPIVTTPCFGVFEQCIEGYNALYYEPEDVVKLTSHLTTLIENPDKRRALGQKSRELFNQMQTYDEMISRYHDKIVGVKRV